MRDVIRCPWCMGSEEYQRYHDEEWGKPLHDESKHFEMLMLETMQAGLSWHTILKKREGFRQAFAGFDAKKITQFSATDVERLMSNPNIIRHRGKISATISNAKAFLDIQNIFGGYDAYIWHFTQGKVIDTAWTDMGDIPTRSVLSDTIAKDLKKRGFKFVGSTTIYAYLQAIGVLNDHLVTCWKRN